MRCGPHARVSRHARCEKLYYEVNRGECGRDSRFGYARGTSFRENNEATGRANEGRNIAAFNVVLKIYVNFLSNGQIL